ncbi:MAG: hypothetical protein HQ553_08460 [Chloroflexi bacterium]|nr:hypothetical protein [Chloroflexota bacterium]
MPIEQDIGDTLPGPMHIHRPRPDSAAPTYRVGTCSTHRTPVFGSGFVDSLQASTMDAQLAIKFSTAL